MPANDARNLSSTPNGDLGQQLGRLKSTSETKQMAIVAVSLLGWGALWQLGIINGFTFFVGNLSTIIGIYLLLLNFAGDALYLFERGLELRVKGKSTVFGFEEITSIAAKHTHHYMRHTYVATKAELTFEVEGRFTNFGFQCDYRRNDSKEQLIELVLQQCSEAVQHRLLAKLQAEGEVLWTDNVYLTESGVKIVDATEVSRLVPFGDIEEMKMRDNQLNIWKRGDAMPFMVLSNEATNFVPLLGLFRKLTTYSRDPNGQDEAETMDAYVVAETRQPVV